MGRGLARGEPRLKGIIPWAPLEKGEGARPFLERLARLPGVKGVRRIIQYEPDPEFCLRPDFVRGVQLLAEFGWSFDLCISHVHLKNTIELVRRCPGVSFVLDHVGKPNIKERIWQPWADELARLARLPNVACKVSGMVTEDDHGSWKRENLKPYIDHVLECFGFDRVVFGGDWPVVTLAASYPQWAEALEWALAGCTPAERSRLYRENALRIYRLGTGGQAMRLEDRVAIVTGGSKGIGEGIARVFSAEGARVVIASRGEEEGLRMAAALGAAEGRALYVPTDVRSSESIQRLIRTTVERFGKLDILVNNAGYHISKNIEATSEEEWELIITTNLRSTFLCSKYAIPHLRRSRGNIINISSMVGLVGQTNAGAYSASKGGQIAMTRGMALDFARDGIRVNAICPGWVQTPLVEDWFSQQADPEAARKYIFGAHPLGRIATIEECGQAAAFLASADAAFITGITLNIEGGVTLGY